MIQLDYQPQTEGARRRLEHTYCVIIPAFHEEVRIRSVLSEVTKFADNVVVVDDGSSDRTSIEAAYGNVHVITHPRNKGKGAALETGFIYAREHGYDFVITMDADGQHSPDDIPVFIEAYVRTGIPILIGNRMARTQNMPSLRRRTNQIMSWMLSRFVGQYIPDTQNGFRLYRTDVIPYVSVETEGYAAESEILLQAGDRGFRIDSVPVKTIYNDSRSDIHPIRDSFRFFRMLLDYRKAKRHRMRR